jgi:hypothetical protein
MTCRYPLPIDWEHELGTLEAIDDDEFSDRLADLDRMAAAAGVTTAYHEPAQPEPRWHSVVAMLLCPVIGVCAVGIVYAVVG